MFTGQNESETLSINTCAVNARRVGPAASPNAKFKSKREYE